MLLYIEMRHCSCVEQFFEILLGVLKITILNFSMNPLNQFIWVHPLMFSCCTFILAIRRLCGLLYYTHQFIHLLYQPCRDYFNVSFYRVSQITMLSHLEVCYSTLPFPVTISCRFRPSRTPYFSCFWIYPSWVRRKRLLFLIWMSHSFIFIFQLQPKLKV